DAAKIVLKAMLHSMVPADGAEPTHEATLVAFRGYADTVFPLNPVDETTIDFLEAIIDAVPAGGSTSIGDGALEAQSILAEAYDALSSSARPDALAMIVASDGLNTHPAWPADYYYRSDFDVPEDHKDDNGPWYQEGPLQRRPRFAEGLPLPRVSTIAIGQDADLAELQALAYYGLGSFMYLPGPDSGSTLTSATLDFADSFGESFNGLSGYERITSARVNGAVPGAMPVILVEDGALELRVSVVSATEPTTELELMAPDGQIHTFTSATSNAQTAVFRVLAPRSGAWTFTGAGGSTTNDPSVFVEATVRSQVRLFASADVAIVHGLGGNDPPDSG
ncbi:MAG: VWA domain-containing protein, partial [Polyangiaceae bacterium]